MRTLYTVFRLVGYIGGLAGVALLMLARRESPPDRFLLGCGGTAVIAGFASFVGSYMVFVMLRFRARNSPRKTPAGARQEGE